MDRVGLTIMAFSGGVFLALQAGLNSQLANLLKNPFLALGAAYICSSLFAGVLILLNAKGIPTVEELKKIPVYLWFLGSLFSVIGIGLYYYTIPKLGISTMISFGLFGQLLFASVAGHFGWLNLPVEPMDVKRIAGILAMLSGIALINLK